MNLFLLHTINMGGEPVVEFYASELSLQELNLEQDDYFPYLGHIDEEDAIKMKEQGLDPAKSIDCVNYALQHKEMAIPKDFYLFTVNDSHEQIDSSSHFSFEL